MKWESLAWQDQLVLEVKQDPEVRVEPQEAKDLLDPEESQAHQDHQDLLENLVQQGLLDQEVVQVKEENQVLLANLDHQDLQDLRDPEERQVCLDHLDLEVPLVRGVRLVYLAHKGKEVKLEPLEPLAQEDSLDSQDPMVSQDHQDLQDQEVKLVHRAPEGRQGSLEREVCLVLLELLAREVSLVEQVQLVHQDREVNQDFKGGEENLDRGANLAHLVPQVRYVAC